ncbi:hypothetical protein N0V95_002035 [Ascochyta clinopodiicola]|nr:hypothetical protein N0V95_002035 [Ascochyta clinopodiicola]
MAADPAPKPAHWRLVASQTLITTEILDYTYPGSGTDDDPYSVDWIPNDPRSPMNLSFSMKWLITMIMALGTLSVSFASTAFSGTSTQIKIAFDVPTIVATLTVSLFVLGFALGPMSWAPASELYGRQYLAFAMFGLVTIFGGASIASNDIATLLVLRAFAGIFGASSIVNSAGVISDMFVASERGLAVTIYCSAPFLGPTLGPIAGGFLGQYAGWRWVDAMTVIFTGVLWFLTTTLVPETYAPYLLARRAKKLSQITGRVYRSKLEVGQGQKKPSTVFKVTIFRPWVLLFAEPIVLLVAVYAAIVYGILYLTFSAFPIVFSSERHWSQGISGLSFIGIMVGQLVAMLVYVLLDKRYKRLVATNGWAAPEARLEPALIGCIAMPVGLFWFAFTTYRSIPWIVCLIGAGFFGFGQVLLFISMMNYTIDAYTVYAASALAANAILRALFGAAL